MNRPPFIRPIRSASFRRGTYTLSCGHTVSARLVHSRMRPSVCRDGEVVCVACLRPWLAGCSPSLFKLKPYRELADLIADEEPPSVGAYRVERQGLLPIDGEAA